MSSQIETETRIAISGFQNGIRHLDRLPLLQYDSALEKAQHHARETMHQLREWAQANDIEISEGMPT